MLLSQLDELWRVIRFIEYPELAGTHKDHEVQLLALQRTPPKFVEWSVWICPVTGREQAATASRCTHSAAQEQHLREDSTFFVLYKSSQSLPCCGVWREHHLS